MDDMMALVSEDAKVVSRWLRTFLKLYWRSGVSTLISDPVSGHAHLSIYAKTNLDSDSREYLMLQMTWKEIEVMGAAKTRDFLSCAGITYLACKW